MSCGFDCLWTVLTSSPQAIAALAVGLLGFLGVMATLLFNASLARRQQRANAALVRVQHEHQTAHERKSVRAALREELKLLETMFRERIEGIKGAEANSGNGLLVPLDAAVSVYQAMISRLGVLTTDEIEKVVRAYGLVSQLPSRIDLTQANFRPAGEPRSSFIAAGSDTFVAIKELHESYLPIITAAIEALKRAGDIES